MLLLECHIKLSSTCICCGTSLYCEKKTSIHYSLYCCQELSARINNLLNRNLFYYSPSLNKPKFPHLSGNINEMHKYTDRYSNGSLDDITLYRFCMVVVFTKKLITQNNRRVPGGECIKNNNFVKTKPFLNKTKFIWASNPRTHPRSPISLDNRQSNGEHIISQRWLIISPMNNVPYKPKELGAGSIPGCGTHYWGIMWDYPACGEGFRPGDHLLPSLPYLGRRPRA